MGHTRLGFIPKSQSWTAVVTSLTARVGGSEGGVHGTGTGDAVDRATVAAVAERTLEAARGGLERAKDDPGLRYTVFLLTQVALASREGDWQRRLNDLGLRVSDEGTLLDLTVEFQGAVDDWLAKHGRRSDFSEMAQRAAGEALVALAAPRAQTLFGESGEELRLAVRSLSTRSGFADLGQAFFGRFMAGFLNFYLSRITATHLGEGRLQQVSDISAFDRALTTHCEQSARIVRDFAGQWYSKAEFEGGISPEKTGRFVAVALSKLREELRRQQSGERSMLADTRRTDETG